MGRVTSRLKKKVFGGAAVGAAVAGIFILLLFAAGCSSDLLDYVMDKVAWDEAIEGVIELPRTGQTDSYATGDDGDLEKGVAWPSPRFTNNGDGTITDNLTGLMWQQAGDDSGQIDWTSALNYANTRTLGGYGDWRLPNIKELRSLANYSQDHLYSWLNDRGFAGIPMSSSYWSSTTVPLQSGSAFRVSMNIGDKTYADKLASSFRILAVRSGQSGGAVSLPQTGQTTGYYLQEDGEDGELRKGTSWPDPRFAVGVGEHQGCICDGLTGLVWQQAPDSTGRSWSDAVSYAYNLTLGGYSDWRLPNVNELESLMNAGQINSAEWLNEQGFIDMQIVEYWSSSGYDSSNAWYIFTGTGTVGDESRGEDSFCALAVRDGE